MAETYYLRVTVKVRKTTDPYGKVNMMADAVKGEITAYDVSTDGQTWLYGGDRLEESEV